VQTGHREPPKGRLVFLLALEDVVRGAEFRGLPQEHLILPDLFLSLWMRVPDWVFLAFLL
jgi:hypothetical protein